MKRKHIFLAVAGLAAILSLLLLAGCCDSLHSTEQIQDKTPDVYPQTISNKHLTQHGSSHQISSLEAREIAVNFVGYGVAHDVLAFTDQDTLIFEVDVRDDAVRYVVQLNAESGNVKNLHRHEHESAVADVSTDTDAAPNEYVTQTTDEATQPTANQPENGQENRPSNTPISLERAIEIANADLTSRGISATYHSNSGIDRERGQRVWELLFVTHGERMPLIEYYINVDNGSIVKFEWDD